MSLDLTQVAAQIQGMASRLKIEEKERDRHLSCACETLRRMSVDLDSLKKKIASSRTSWLVAGLTDGLDRRYQPLPCPADYSVIASDGSHIDVDRHSPARCYLINIGTVFLRYGKKPNAILQSRPSLFARPDELTIVDPLGSGDQPVNSALLGIKRAVAECQALAETAELSPPDIPALAMLDGSLILWGLSGQVYPDYVKCFFLEDGLLPALERLRIKSLSAKLALVSYISAPRSTEVINALRVAICPYNPPDCDKCCPRNSSAADRACEAVAGVADSNVFSLLLKPGERSSTFISRSSVVKDHYGEHEVRFFYLKNDAEIGRVEFPRWVEETGLIDYVHTLILDQCRRGHGYPVALSEAHERAVVNVADREQFRQLVELALDHNRMTTTATAKDHSKRTRWV